MTTPMLSTSARGTAWTILQQSRRKEGFAAELIDRALQTSALTGPDRGFVTQLVFGVMRRRSSLDALVIPFMTRHPDKVQPELWDVLHLGAYQLAFLTHVPSHAAVHEAVELAGSFNPGAKGFVNGILRRVAEVVTGDFDGLPAEDAIPLEEGQYRKLAKPLLPNPKTAPVEYLAAGFGWQEWLAERWFRRDGWEECTRLGFWFLASPAIWLRCNRLNTTRDDYRQRLLDAGIKSEPGSHPQSLKLKGHPPIRFLPGYTEGDFAVQDDSAMAVATALAPEPRSRVLDLCAAPGGKTTHLAELMNDQGTIIACDIDAERLKTVTTLCQRLGINIVKTRLLAPEAKPPAGPFDAILLDVPCSNTGVLGRRPEVRWRLTTTDLQHLVPLQRRLIRDAARELRRGGTLVYSTCSIEPEENQDVVKAALREMPELVLEEERLARPGQPADGGYWAKLLKR